MASSQSHVPVTELTRERLSWQQLCARHPDEWVTLIDLEWEKDDEDGSELVSAVCIGNGKRRGDSLQATVASQGGSGRTGNEKGADLQEVGA
jgi:hypothetical protein